MSRVLVTGATGFVGGHLLTALAEAGYLLRGTFRTRPPKGYPEAVEWRHLADVGPDADWSPLLEGVDYVVHLAGLAHRPGIKDEELRESFHHVNVLGTERLVQDVRGSQVKRLVFISSAKAMQMGVSPAADEPDSEYGRSKLAAERIVARGLEGSGTDWCVLRPCLVYGPGNLGNMARLIKLIRLGWPLPFASIRNQKNFIYVGNLVSAIALAMTHPAASRRVFAVSDGISLSTPELLLYLGRHTSQKVRLFPMPIAMMKGVARVGDLVREVTGISVGWDSYSVDRLCSSLTVDCQEFFHDLDWTPPYSMDEGVRLTMLNPLGNGDGR